MNQMPGRRETAASTTDEHPEVRKLKEKIRRLELAVASSRQFSSTLDVDDLMSTVLSQVAEAIHAEAGSFWMLDTQSNQIICKVATGPAKDKVCGMRLDAGTGIVGWTIANKQKTVVFDASKDERFFNRADQETQFVTKSVFCVPLMVGRECVGALSMLNKQTDDGIFDQEDLDLLEMLALNAAVAIKNAQLFQSKIRIKELNILLDIGKEVSSTLDLDRVLLSIVNLGSQIIHYKRALIGILDSDERIKLSAESDCTEPDMTRPENKAMLNIMKHVLASGRTLHITGFNREAPPDDMPRLIIDYMVENEVFCLSVIILKDSEGVLGLLAMEGIYSALIAGESTYVINILVNTATVSIRNAQLYHSIPRTFIGARLAADKGKKGRRRLLLATAILLLGLFSATVKLPADVTANVEIVPNRTTQVSALADGVVSQIAFQEGELLEKGRIMAVLGDPLLALEKARLVKDRRIAFSELRRLESESEPYKVQLKRLEIESLDSRIRYTDYRSRLTRITAPVEGRVLTARPQELLDKQVVRGEMIAQLAVGDKKSGRLMLQETDVLKVKPGDRITFSLKAMPERVFDGTVGYIAYSLQEQQPAEAIQGKETVQPSGYPVFFSSGRLDELSSIRFGMTGTGRIHIARQTLYTRWLKPLVERLRSEMRLMISD